MCSKSKCQIDGSKPAMILDQQNPRVPESENSSLILQSLKVTTRVICLKMKLKTLIAFSNEDVTQSLDEDVTQSLDDNIT